MIHKVQTRRGAVQSTPPPPHSATRRVQIERTGRVVTVVASNHHETRSGVQRSGTPFRGTVAPARLFRAPVLLLVLLLEIFL